MCKNPNAVIETAKRDTPEVYALYHDGNLDGIVKVFNGVLAIAYDIVDNDELSYFDKSNTKNMPNRYELTRRLFGVESGLIRRLYHVAAC